MSEETVAPTNRSGFWNRARAAGLLAPALATIASLCLLVGLGTWQLQRKAWKEGLLRDIAQRSTQPPADIGDVIFTSPPPAFTHVRLIGRFMHDRERYWFSDGRLGSGFQVFTPFEVAPGRIVWVNRGYIPATLRDPQLRPLGQVAGTVTVSGLVREVGERNMFTPANDPARNIWFWRDLPALQASAFTPDVTFAKIMIDADAAPANPGGWPEGGTLPSLPNRHLEYALTWYGLALTLIAVFLSFAHARLAQSPE